MLMRRLLVLVILFLVFLVRLHGGADKDAYRDTSRRPQAIITAEAPDEWRVAIKGLGILLVYAVGLSCVLFAVHTLYGEIRFQ
jgi:hypothetical protein